MMLKYFSRIMRSHAGQSGQVLVEYKFLMAVCSAALFMSLPFLGSALVDSYQNSTDKVSKIPTSIECEKLVAFMEYEEGSEGKAKNNNGHGNNEDGVDVSNPGQGKGGPNGQVDESGDVDDEKKNGGGGYTESADGFSSVEPPDCGDVEPVEDDCKNNNGHGNNEDGVDVSNPGNGNGGPNGKEDQSGNVDDENKGDPCAEDPDPNATPEPTPVASACIPAINFDVDAAGNPIVAGQIIDDEWAAWGVTVSTSGANPAMIFDSTNPTGGDVDLGTPNAAFGGPGVGADGAAGLPGENSVALGNVLIITEDGDSNDPDDDSRGGTIVFDFANPVTIEGVGVLDIEPGGKKANVTFYGTDGKKMGTEQFNSYGDNSVETLSVNYEFVSRMEFELVKSGAMTQIQSCQ